MAGVGRYKAVLPAEGESVTVAAVPRGVGAAAVITPADADTDAGNGHQVAVAPGQTQSIAVTVTAADGATVKTWTVERNAARRWLYAIGRQRCGTRSGEAFRCDGLRGGDGGAPGGGGIGRDLNLSDEGITALKAGDFAGLTSMNALHLNDNPLTRLPPGIFDGLPALSSLYLDDTDLAELPAGLLMTCRF